MAVLNSWLLLTMSIINGGQDERKTVDVRCISVFSIHNYSLRTRREGRLGQIGQLR